MLLYYLAKHVDLEAFQQALIANWKQEIPDGQVVLVDATHNEIGVMKVIFDFQRM